MATKNKTIGGLGAAAAIAAAITFIAPWEGVELRAYRDIVGVPTICYGETRGVKMGDTATHTQCETQLAKAVAEFEKAGRECLPAQLPDKTRASFLSFSYNLGPRILCNSPTMSRLIKARDIAGACKAMTMFNRAGGKVVRGLTRRREAEKALCLSGLAGQ
ncbi:lysozyme [Cypionkella sp.]|uniref:lysozyme n=1 Tax=Cypionkella sp. TaxID=2811411 RepID=UPI002AB8955B|nr:lysozyme [Cypionkella sp.]MDZ4392501.1 lysozyme [Cypionkella sp.]